MPEGGELPPEEELEALDQAAAQEEAAAAAEAEEARAAAERRDRGRRRRSGGRAAAGPRPRSRAADGAARRRAAARKRRAASGEAEAETDETADLAHAGRSQVRRLAGKPVAMRFQVLAVALIVAQGPPQPRSRHLAAASARADLVVNSLANPPAVVSAGDGFSARDRTRNIGEATARATVTRYYLSKAGSGRKSPGARSAC